MRQLSERGINVFPERSLYIILSCQCDYLWQSGLGALKGESAFWGVLPQFVTVSWEVVANHRKISQQSSYTNNSH